MSLDPEPSFLTKRTLKSSCCFGDYRTYQLLQHYDASLVKLFRVTADFEDEIRRAADSEMHYARFILSIVHDNNMLLWPQGARIIEHRSSRQSGDQGKLSCLSSCANLLRESLYVARGSKSNLIRASHVDQTLSNQQMRVGRLHQDSVMETFTSFGTTLIHVDGEAVGQVNRCRYWLTTDHMFGAPNRIGNHRLWWRWSDWYWKNVDLGGSIHSRGDDLVGISLFCVWVRRYKVRLLLTSLSSSLNNLALKWRK